MVRTQEASVLYVHSKCEWDSYKFISYKGPKILKLGHVTLSHAPFEHETLNLCIQIHMSILIANFFLLLAAE